MPKSPTQQELKDKFNQGVNDLKYKAFLAEAENAGKMGEFSPYDLALAQANPNAGMGILEAKKTGDNAAAQGIRTTQGGYYADSSGLGATPINAAGRELVKGVQSQQPNYSSVLTESYKSTSTPGQSSGAFEYEPGPQRQPSYYEPNYRAVLEEARNYQPFSYNVEGDPAYQAYAKAYRREGDRAAQNALAGAAGMTGGIPSSYAVGAATQAGSYYASQLSDKIPELYQQAYNRYLQEYSRRLGLADYYRQGMNDEESRYLSDVNRYNTDRNFAYGAYRDELADAERAETTEYNRTLAAQQYQDELAAAQAKAAYQQQQDDLDYGKWVAEFEADQSNKALANAIKVADALGYVPGQYASILGVPAGTSTADAAYKAAKGTSAKGSGAGSGNSSGGSTNSDSGNGNGVGNSGSSNGDLVTVKYNYNEKPDSRYTSSAATSVDYDENSGIIRWNGTDFRSLENLAQALMDSYNDGFITDADIMEIARKLRMYGLNLEIIEDEE